MAARGAIMQVCSRWNQQLSRTAAVSGSLEAAASIGCTSPCSSPTWSLVGRRGAGICVLHSVFNNFRSAGGRVERGHAVVEFGFHKTRKRRNKTKKN